MRFESSVRRALVQSPDSLRYYAEGEDQKFRSIPRKDDGSDVSTAHRHYKARPLLYLG